MCISVFHYSATNRIAYSGVALKNFVNQSLDNMYKGLTRNRPTFDPVFYSHIASAEVCSQISEERCCKLPLVTARKGLLQDVNILFLTAVAQVLIPPCDRSYILMPKWWIFIPKVRWMMGNLSASSRWGGICNVKRKGMCPNLRTELITDYSHLTTWSQRYF